MRWFPKEPLRADVLCDSGVFSAHSGSQEAAAEIRLHDLWHRTHECLKYNFTFTAFFVNLSDCQIRCAFRSLYWTCLEEENEAWGQLGIIRTFIFCCWGFRGASVMVLSEEKVQRVWVDPVSPQYFPGGLTGPMVSTPGIERMGGYLWFPCDASICYIVSALTDKLCQGSVFESISLFLHQ